MCSLIIDNESCANIPNKAKVEVFMGFKGKSDTQPKRTRNVKCFRCH